MQKNKDEGLTAWQLTMLALGTVVGGSFFLGSSIAIKAAGPSILLSFVIGGILVYLILTALSEMTIADPRTGSFRSYSEETFGPMVGFLVGWVYWTGLVLAMSSEAIAVSYFLRQWIPGLSPPVISSLIVIGVTLINLMGSKKLSNLESVLALIKIGALLVFTFLGFLLISGLLPNKPTVGLGYLNNEPFFAAGIGGVSGSMLIVLFSYAGFEIIGLAASEAKAPGETIPKAIIFTVLGLVGLYCLVIMALLPLIPTGVLSDETSPMVLALRRRGLFGAANFINTILIVAILSTMIAATFGLGRMLRSLSNAGHAPSFLIDKKDVPYRGILFSGAAMLISLGLGYMLPRQVYIFLVSSGGFSLLFAYLIILITHYKFRKKYGCPPYGECQLPGYPYSSWIAISGLIIVILTMPLIPGQGSGLFAGLLFVLGYLFLYIVFKGAPQLLKNKNKDIHKILQLNLKTNPKQILDGFMKKIKRE